MLYWRRVTLVRSINWCLEIKGSALRSEQIWTFSLQLGNVSTSFVHRLVTAAYRCGATCVVHDTKFFFDFAHMYRGFILKMKGMHGISTGWSSATTDQPLKIDSETRVTDQYKISGKTELLLYFAYPTSSPVYPYSAGRLLLSNDEVVFGALLCCATAGSCRQHQMAVLYASGKERDLYPVALKG